MISVKDIRHSFLEFFKKNDHQIVSSSSLVPTNDPTLLFTNAGMVQFKDYFTGTQTSSFPRAATTQKCVRAGGKHNDLENVGYTARHHTFFEMLGNFSFGDYFKEKAITYAWDLLTKEWGFAKNKLLVTVYSEDDEAALLWKKIAGLGDDKIIRIPTSDNFWSMGDTGPCGPCSEIFYDHGDGIFGGPPGSEHEDGDRFIEVWNLVFMQFEQKSKDERIPLPRPSIDTGMGLERLAAILQGKHNNYEIDLFQKIINESWNLTNVTDPNFIASHRVIADHLRSSSFLMADGVTPSNEGRGYVLRRIMRRAMRHVHLLGYKDLLLHKLVPTLVGEMGDAYPELVRAQSLLVETFKLEEERFRETLSKGIALLDQVTSKLSQGSVLDGEVAFKLYDTYGFPVDLTQDILRGKQISVDLDTFNLSMEKQKENARKAWTGSGDAQTESVWFAIQEKFGSTEFLGYESDSGEGLIEAVLIGGAECQSIQEGDEATLILNQTPFYAESGGQMGDIGFIKTSTGTFQVLDCQKKLGSLHLHKGFCLTGEVGQYQTAKLSIDKKHRQAIKANHSATHLLHAVLRETLGDHVTQKGSLVASDRLRFDFSHNFPISAEDLAKIEDKVNSLIFSNSPSTVKVMTPEEAMKTGAMALFGEKYGEQVRVVSMGVGKNKPYSIELCGGTHVHATGDIGLFKILSETSVASGIRRIEAITSHGVVDYIRKSDEVLDGLTQSLKIKKDDLVKKIQQDQIILRSLENEIKSLKMKLAQSNEDEVVGKTINGVNLFSQTLDGLPVSQMRSLLDDMKKKNGSGIYVLGGIEDDKISLIVGISDDLTSRFDAVDFVKASVDFIGGKGGGGRKDMAQAGGNNSAGLPKVFSTIEELISKAG